MLPESGLDMQSMSSQKWRCTGGIIYRGKKKNKGQVNSEEVAWRAARS